MNKILSVLAVTVALFGVSAQAHAAEKYSSRTRGNSASFQAWTSSECGYQSVSVWAFEEDQRGQGNTTSYDAIYVDYYSYDYCTGTDSWGSSVIDSSSFDMQRLNGASLDASGSIDLYVCEYGGGGTGGMGGTGGVGGMAGTAGDGGDGGVPSDPCGYASVALDVSLDFVGTGDTTRDRYTSTYTTPHSRYTSRYSGQSRAATVTGSILIDGSAVDLTDGYGTLSASTSGYFEMYR